MSNVYNTKNINTYIVDRQCAERLISSRNSVEDMIVIKNSAQKFKKNNLREGRD